MWIALHHVASQSFRFQMFQDEMDILCYSYPRFCLDSVHGVRLSVTVNLCEFFDIWLHWGWILICQQFCCFFSRMLFTFRGLIFSFIFTIRLCEEELFFVWDIWGGYCDLIGCCVYIFQDFEMDLFRDSQLLSWIKSAAVSTGPAICRFFWEKLQHKVTCFPHRRWESICLKEIGDWFLAL